MFGNLALGCEKIANDMKKLFLTDLKSSMHFFLNNFCIIDFSFPKLDYFMKWSLQDRFVLEYSKVRFFEKGSKNHGCTIFAEICQSIQSFC